MSQSADDRDAHGLEEDDHPSDRCVAGAARRPRVMDRGELGEYVDALHGPLDDALTMVREFSYGHRFDESYKLADWYRLYRDDLDRAVKLATELSELLERLGTREPHQELPT